MKQNFLFFSLLTICVLLGAGADERCNERCCLNYYEDQYGSCIECPPGTSGLNCTGTCVPYYFGRLCRRKCDCPLHQCDLKIGCRKSERWDISITLTITVIIAVLMGLLILTKFWLYNRCLQLKEIMVPTQIQTGNVEEEQRYERRTSLSFPNEVENIQQRGQFNENNYTEMRLSVVSRVYDDPKCELDQKSYAMPSKSKQPLTTRTLLHEYKSSNGEDDEYKECGHLFEHEM